MTHRRIVPVALAAVATVLLFAHGVHAQSLPRTVVLRFEGSRAEQARRAVVRGLEGSYELVEEGALIDAADRIQVDVSTPEGMAAVVEHLGVTLVVGGFVEGSGRRATTTVWVMDVRGNELTRRQTSGPTGRNAAREIAQAATEATAEAMAVLQRPPPEPVPVEDESPIDPELDHEPPPGDVEPVDVSGRWNQPYVRALLGLRVRNRTIAVTPDTFTNRFDSDFFPDLRLLVEVRPFARDPGGLRGLYFALSGGVSVGITYLQQDGDAPSMTTFDFEVDAGYGLVLAEMVELVLSLGVGMDGVDLADVQPIDFPSTLYSFVRPAVQGRIRLIPDHLLVAELGLGGRFVWDSGAIQDPTRFGPDGTTAGGVDFYLGLAGTVEPGFSWAARFAYTSYFLGFNGGAEESRATDEAIQILLLIGWAF